MSTKIDVINMAYAHIGKGTFIASESDTSVEAKIANLFFVTALKARLRSFNWPFARKFANLNLIQDNSLNNSSGPAVIQPEWLYWYQWPSDCVAARRILSGTRNDTNESRVPFWVTGTSKGRQIRTDQPSAILEYTFYVDTLGLADEDFCLCVSYDLALLLLSKVTAGDPLKIRDRLMQGQKMAFELAAA